MDDLDDVLGDLADLSAVPRLLVAVGFDGALAEPGSERAEQPSSEALNVLMALPATEVAVVSPRPADEVSELMFLSGAKVGAPVVTPEELRTMRAESGAACVVVDVDPASLRHLGPDDLGVLVTEDEDDDADLPGVRRLPDVDAVAELLGELADLRRRPRAG